MIRSLVWKEWHEQRWKLAFASVMLAGVAAIGLDARVVPDEAIHALVIMIGAMGIPLLVSMGLFAAERHEGSLQTLLSLPIRPWKILVVKLAMGIAVCAGSLAAAAIVACLASGGREVARGDIVLMFLGAMGTSAVFLMWMVAAAIRQPTEARAAMTSVGVVAAWLIVIVVFAAMRVSDLWLWLFHPFTFVFMAAGGQIEESRWRLCAVQVLILALLWFWMLWRLPLPRRVRA